MDMYTVYILHSIQYNRYYIGSTGNLVKRLERHNSMNVRSTKHCAPWKVVYTEQYITRSLAVQREKQIKRYKGGNAFKKLIDK